jgi:hypothetical protein
LKKRKEEESKVKVQVLHGQLNPEEATKGKIGVEECRIYRFIVEFDENIL